MSTERYTLLGSPKEQADWEDRPDVQVSGSAKSSPDLEKHGGKRKSNHRRSHSYASVPSGVSSWHNGPAIPELEKWKQVETLERPWTRNLRNCSMTLLLLMFPAAYLGLAITVAVLHGQPIPNLAGTTISELETRGTYNTIQQIITVAVTLFPVIFALVIGKTLKTAAQYRAERGTTLIHIEQLIASKTFGSTLFAPLSFKRINILGVVLLSLWLLSPLTTQALQRMFSATSDLVSVRHENLYYLNTNNARPDILRDPFSGVEDIMETSLNPLYLSQLMQPLSDSTVDVYGNPKIPLIEKVASRSSQDLQGFYSVRNAFNSVNTSRDSNDSIRWSSSTGIPIEGLPNTRSSYDTYTELMIETSYWGFQCSPWEKLKGFEVLTMAGPSPYRFMTNCGVDCVHQLGMNESKLSSSVSLFFMMGGRKNSQGYRTLRFGSRNGGVAPGQYGGSEEPTFTTTECEMRLEQVEAGIVCEGKACEVRRIRLSSSSRKEKPHPGVARMALRVLGYISPPQFMTVMIGSSYLEKWLYDPGKLVSDANQDLVNDSLFPGEKQVNLTTIPIHEFETRLGYVFSTFYELTIGLFMIPRQLPSQPASKEVMANSPGVYKETVGTISEKNALYHCNWAWFAVLLISCVVVIGAIFANAYMQYHVLGPDVLGYVSTVTQNNPFMPLPRGGSTMGGIDRALRLAHLKVRLQDIDPDGEVGHIALSSIDGQPLRHERKYW